MAHSGDSTPGKAGKTRRQFLQASGAVLGWLGIAAAGCGGDSAAVDELRYPPLLDPAAV